MSTTNEIMSEREEIEMLLPWYVTGKLDAADRARVEGWLARAPDLKRQLDLVRAEQTESVALNEAIRAPASLTVEKTFATAQGKAGVLTKATAWLNELFTMPTAGAVRWAAAAAGVVMLLQAAALGYLANDRSGVYGQAGGPQAVSSPATYALVRFADTATAKDISAALGELGMTIVEGPRQGMFRVKLDSKVLSDSDRDARIAVLKARAGLVVLVTPSP